MFLHLHICGLFLGPSSTSDMLNTMQKCTSVSIVAAYGRASGSFVKAVRCCTSNVELHTWQRSLQPQECAVEAHICSMPARILEIHSSQPCAALESREHILGLQIQAEVATYVKNNQLLRVLQHGHQRCICEAVVRQTQLCQLTVPPRGRQSCELAADYVQAD
jgi:hypothetical protein